MTARRAAPPHEVRISGGVWKRSRLPVPAGAVDLRPTPSRVRETLYDWIGPAVVGARVVDAFGGTGALGLEAASRGAASVVVLETDHRLARSLEATCARLGASQVRIERADAIGWLGRAAPAAFDLVLLDPPFASALARPALAAAAAVVAPGGFVYLEAGEPFDPAAFPAPAATLAVHRALRAGAVHATLFRAF